MFSDTHPYFAFGYPDPTPITAQTIKPCSPRFNQSMAAFGMTAAGEFSNAFNDCGLFLNGVGNGARYDGTFVFEPGPGAGPGACVKWMDASTWSAEEKAAIKKFALSSMDSMQVCTITHLF
jgi:glucan 1,3-beta-glucosidase